MKEEGVLKTLESIVGKERVSASDLDRFCYSITVPPSGDFLRIKPAIVIPENTLEISNIMRLSNHYQIPVTPREEQPCSMVPASPWRRESFWI